MKQSNIEAYYNKISVQGGFKQLGFLSRLREMLLAFEEERKETAVRNFVKTDKYLDIGCNDGGLLVSLNRKYNFGYGVDISQKVVMVAKKNIKKLKIKNVVIKKANIENGLPFGDNTFTAITFLAVLEHLFDPVAALKETYRVMKKGGLLYLEVPNIAWLPRRINLLLGRRPRTSFAPGWEGGHLQYFTYSELETLLITVGYKIVRRDCSGVFNQLRKIYPPLLSGNIFLICKK
jgi:ubiquinone/menaquinone biosynthesis C-methylase UbiE